MTNKDEIVKLIIEGENLLSEDVNSAIKDLERLGKESREATAELKKLKQADEAAAAFKRLSASIKASKEDSDRLAIQLEKTKKEIKELGDTTNDELVAKLNQLKREFRETNTSITAQTKELNKAENTLRKHGLSTRNLADQQKGLKERITQATEAQKRAKGEYEAIRGEMDKQVLAVRKERAERLGLLETLEMDGAERKALTAIAEKQYLAATRISDVLQDETVSRSKIETAIKSENTVRKKNIALYESLVAEHLRAEQAIEEYSDKIRVLAQHYKNGEINAESYLNAQEEIRKELGLQERQVQRVRQAIEADITARKKAVDNTQRQQNAIVEENKALKRSAVALDTYTAKLKILVNQRNKGILDAKDYQIAEAKLAKELKLTAAQTKVTRLEEEKLIQTRKKARGGTDILTSATRRLAQAYTVLLAAQKATQAISTSVNEYSELEAAITKVEKTVDLGKEKIAEMADELQRMSTEITPTATNELLRYAEVAGQLGAESSEDILSLVAAADALEVSTNLAGDEAAKLLTRILTLTGEGLPKIQNLASAVVELGNNFAASEDEIVHMTKEIATAGTALDLGSASAAAFGTTLKAIGLPAERSRTAMLRLAQVIKQASIQGGDDLKSLLKITGQTADEFENALGSRPQETIVKFLEGLQRLQDGGQTVAASLDSVGIAGTDALSVLEGLSKNTITLKHSLLLANGAFEDANKHFEEAAKAYANQESAILRLNNVFTKLKATIGEAYTDEVDGAIRGATDLLNEQSESIVSVMEVVGDLGAGLVELGTAMGDLFAPFTGMTQGLEETLDYLSINFNIITIGARNLGLAINEAVILLHEGLNALGAENEAQLERMREKSEQIKGNINQDVKDISNAYKRLTGESSRSYEDLINTVDKYNDAVRNLTPTQKDQLLAIIAEGKANDDLNNTYRELTASIVKQQRQIEIKAELEAQEEERARRRHENEKLRKAEEAQFNRDVQATLKGIGFSKEKLKELERQLDERYKANAISAVEYGKQLKILAGAEQELTESSKAVTKAQEALDEASENSLPALTSLSASLEKQKLALYNLNLEIAKTTEGTALYNTLIAKRAELERSIEENSKRLAELQKFEKMTIFELTEAKRKHLFTMELLESQYKSGGLSIGEYREQMDKLKITLDVMNELLGDSGTEHEDTTEKVKTHTRAILDQAAAMRELTEETDKNTESMVRNREELVASRELTSGGNDKAAALIKEIGLEAYNEMVRQTQGVLGHTNTGAVAVLRQKEEEAYKRANGGGGGVQQRPSIRDRRGAWVNPYADQSTGQSSTTHNVVITLPDGTQRGVAMASEEAARDLIEVLKGIGNVNIYNGGVV